MRVWLAVGHTDMRRGMNSLAIQVQELSKRDPHAADLYVFRGKRGQLIKILWQLRAREALRTERVLAGGEDDRDIDLHEAAALRRPTV